MSTATGTLPSEKELANCLAEIRRLERLLGTPDEHPTLLEELVEHCHKIRNKMQIMEFRRGLIAYSSAPA